MTLAPDDRHTARAVVHSPIRATVTPGEKTVPLQQRGPGRTRAVLPGQIGVRDAPGTLRQSIIVPTYNERDNVVALLERLAAALPHTETEIVFVDDSTDGTPEVIAEVARDYPMAVTVHHRDEGAGGLGGAVVEGMRIARGEWVVVMDADLQHPPEIVPGLIAAGLRDGADLVVGSRYAGGGSTGGLADGYRKLVSRGSTILVKTLFRHQLLSVSDPMSGLFAIRASSLDAGQLRPLGYKILLELIVRNRPGRIVEVPYTFQPRHAGESKSTVSEGLRFLKHVGRLRLGSGRARMLGFGLIGLSGLLPNQAMLWALVSLAGLHYAPAAIAANVVAVLWNFALTDQILYRNRRERRLPARFGRFFLLGNADLLLRIPLLAVLVDGLHTGVLAGNLLTLVASFLLRFLIAEKLIYVGRT
ncbi:dolichol monophosphate mannose synthase [Actinoplanes cyaneus]|uniref:Dolichol monophosphate mannose synthase n=1 Tax=Actinoplanes cyaneus TaxID=52696 RepID=A0A919IKS0_9ACTN|nr:glycosyltransferase family 2 protein [Actinoplanes cyaneus]MCW2141001.1 dolichol-phosphate mannosyltransferase [Actinoplanes cyaneus]GID67062.1 dolichol monophosphate mannose synthase [Actinoplanes cyaneus]